eukprot:14678851-Heterocapsa_arctica.AAC.1
MRLAHWLDHHVHHVVVQHAPRAHLIHFERHILEAHVVEKAALTTSPSTSSSRSGPPSPASRSRTSL